MSVFFTDNLSSLTNPYIQITLSNISYLLTLFVGLRSWVLYFDYKKNKQLLAYKWKSRLVLELQNSAALYNQSSASAVEEAMERETDIMNSKVAAMEMHMQKSTEIQINGVSESDVNSNGSTIRQPPQLISNREYSLPWTMKYDYIFGNFIVLHVIGAFIFVIILLINLFAFYIDEDVFDFVQLFWTVILILLLTIGFFKIHSCQDEIHIRRMFYFFVHVVTVIFSTTILVYSYRSCGVYSAVRT